MSASKFFTGMSTKSADKGSAHIPERIQLTVQVDCYANDESGLPEGAIITFPNIELDGTKYVAGSAVMSSGGYTMVSFEEEVE